ncbi:hypothetical protein [Amphibacillus cookii]|uniref:hypothetical protein n=1 Tax=Amphibacillus cookii TaxID=767787 RepID=UPI0019583F76|nr:hypothetical protein [Amphibacillus cookii]MBM7542725.1 hypothetical protein [Amphibacillus cookii]
MDEKIKECMLTDEQKSLILQGIKNGKEKFQEISLLLEETTTKKHTPFMLYDYVNTYVEKIIEDNPHTQMKVYTRKAGWHPYIVIHDAIRNIFILVLKLPEKKYIFEPSGYREEFSLSNFDRLLQEGVPEERLLDQETHQYSLPLGIENQPFGIVVCYDSKSDVAFEGALKPDQEDWIYKEDITEYINISIRDLVKLNNYSLSDIKTTLKDRKEDEDIVIKLKNNPS